MKEMMKQKMMNRFHKRNSSSASSVDFKPGERLDFKFSSLQALQVPSGWDKLSISLISVETDKTVTKTGKASVCNGNCRWTETLSESIWISPDDSSKELQQCLYKLLISKGSTRSSILGEATVNLSSYMSSEASLPVALPLKKCEHGTILQVAIQCLTPRPNSRWSDTNSLADISDLDNMSEAVRNGFDTKPIGTSTRNSIRDTSNTLGSRETSFATGRSHSSFDSLDSFGRESSHSDVTLDLTGRPESTTMVNVYNSPTSSGKNLLNRRQDSGKVSHNIPASPLKAFSSSEYVGDDDVASEDLRAEARTWERNARKLMVDLELSRKVTSEQTRNLENVTMELSALQTECEDLKNEVKHLKLLLSQSETKEKAADDLKVQVQDKKGIQKELEEELKYLRDLNNDMSMQLNKTQESNLELVSVLQELEETIEKQKLELEQSAVNEDKGEEDTRVEMSRFTEKEKCELELEIQKLKESHGKLESTILDLEETLDEKTREIDDTRVELSRITEKEKCELELEIQKLQESQEKLESTILHLEETLEEKTQEIELEKDLKNRTLLDMESEWTKKLSSKDKQILNLEAKLLEALAVVPDINETELQTVETHDLIEEVKALKDKVMELEQDCNELTDENLELLYKLRESSKNLSENGTTEVDYSLKDSNDKLDNFIIDLKSKVEDLSKEVFSKSSVIEELKSDCLQKEEKIQSQNDCLKELEDKLSDLQIVNSQLEISLTDAKESTRLESVHSESEIKRMESEVANMQNECEVLKKEKVKLQETTEKLMEEFSWIQKCNNELTKQKLEMHNHCTKVEEKLKQSENNFLKLSKNLEDLEEISSTMLREIASKQKLFDSELESLNLKLTEENSSFEVEFKEMQDEIISLKKSVTDVKNENEKLESLNLKFTEENSRVEVELKEMEDEIVTLKKSLIEVKNENEKLEASLQLKSEDYQQLKEEKSLLLEKSFSMQKAVIELEDLKRKKFSMEEKILHLEGDLTALTELKNEVESLKKSNSQLQLKINHLQEEKGSSSGSNNHEDVEGGRVDESARIESLELALDEALEANKMYKIQLKSVVKKNYSLLSEKEEVMMELKKQNGSLKGELNELQERYLNMSLKYAEVEAQREDLVLKLKNHAPGRSWFS